MTIYRDARDSPSFRKRIFSKRKFKGERVESTNSLEDITYQCPKEGGNSVYRARALLKKVGSYVFHDNDDCAKQSKLQSSSTGTDSSLNSNLNVLDKKKVLSNSENWLIFPNPTNGYIYLKGGQLTDVRKVQLFSLTGKMVQVWAGNQIDSSGLRSNESLLDGIYFVKIILQDGTASSRKLIISK